MTNKLGELDYKFLNGKILKDLHCNRNMKCSWPIVFYFTQSNKKHIDILHYSTFDFLPAN